MNRAFLEAYNRELALLYEGAKEFAEDFPGIAERLGGLTQDNLDPAVAGLLEGAAFMAARVQLKLDTEFDTFTSELLDQLLPNFMAPTPSAILAQADPNYAEDELEKGKNFPAGAYLDARYVDRDQRISCRFRLSAPLTLWPLRLTTARFVSGPTGFQALGLDVGADTAGGLILSFLRPASTAQKDKPGKPVSAIQADTLPIYLTGDLGEQIAVYEHMFTNTTRATIRYLDARGDPVFMRLEAGWLEQIGFDETEAIFPEDTRVFRGFTLLREFFLFPQKFLGFRLQGLRKVLPRIPAASFDLMLEMNAVRPSLPARITAENFRLFAAPAINLFEENCAQVKLDTLRHDYLVSADSSPASHYEVHRITEVFAYYAGVKTKIPVHPLYGMPADVMAPREALYYTAKQRPRRLTAKEKRFGQVQGYTGTESFISIYEPGHLDSAERVKRLQIKLLCSNRHLPQYLPIAQGGADFRLNDDTAIPLRCIAGPTNPRESVLELDESAPHRAKAGPVHWRLISFVSLNFLGLDNRGSRDEAAALRELLTLFADVSSQITERQLQGLKAVTSRPVTRTIQRAGGYHAARGTQVTLRFDERAFEGSGVFLLGAVLDRFFAEYASINSFTQLVLTSDQRGMIKTFPPRTGQGPLL
ncbi:type VI secretion system baseplate subunit TssF [Cypionkella psychrotolerans]|uniref:type VI secretion system baseplate subunit TssF n=1 Tax=Cypionkella psychrotolerans TaxID=1678131 RepID=UPI0006B4E6F1|nr:type VI secretion system baseplate subunit TssF [Cypionkella psychrotolerans]